MVRAQLLRISSICFSMMMSSMLIASTLAEVLGISKNTWSNRMKEPWKAFSYDDFKMLAKYCKIDFIALVDGELKIR